VKIGGMPYRIYEGSRFLGEFGSEAEALAAIRDHCRFEGVPLPEGIRAMNISLGRTDTRGRARKWWWSEQIGAMLRQDPTPEERR
jgi:hypothetical protein